VSSDTSRKYGIRAPPETPSMYYNYVKYLKLKFCQHKAGNNSKQPKEVTNSVK